MNIACTTCGSRALIRRRLRRIDVAHCAECGSQQREWRGHRTSKTAKPAPAQKLLQIPLGLELQPAGHHQYN